MSCKASVDLMSLRLDGLLEASKSYELEDHLKTCADCRVTWGDMREADGLLRLNAQKPLVPPPDFLAKVMVKVAATPVARPALWDRVRIEGGRRTAPLPPPARRPTLPLGLPAVPGVTMPGMSRPSGVGGALAALQNRWVRAYLGGLGAAAVLAVLVLAMVAGLLTVGGAQLMTVINQAPALGPVVGPSADVVSTGLQAVWNLAKAWVAGLDLLLVSVIGLGLAGGMALWAYLVRGFLRRADGGKIEA